MIHAGCNLRDSGPGADITLPIGVFPYGHDRSIRLEADSVVAAGSNLYDAGPGAYSTLKITVIPDSYHPAVGF